MPQVREFPLDLWAIQKYGIDRWLEDFSWPVSDEAYFQMWKSLDRRWAHLIQTEPYENSRLLVIRYKVLVEVVQWLHALKVVQLLEMNRLQPVFSEKGRWYQEVMEGSYSVEDKKRSALSPSRLGCVKKIFQWNGAAIVWRYIKPENTGFVFGHDTEFMREVLRGRQRDLILPLLSKGKELSSGDGVNRTALVEKIVKQILEVARENNISVRAIFQSYLMNLISNRIDSAASYVCQAEKMLTKTRVRFLLVNSFSDPVTGAVASVFRDAGKRVISFTHGDLFGWLKQPCLLWLNWSFADDFFCYSEGSVRLFKKQQASLRPYWGRETRLLSGETTVYESLWKRFQNEKPKQTPKKIFLLGFPFNQTRYIHAGDGMFDFFQLDFQLRVFRFLKQQGFDVVFKAHPDQLASARMFFEPEGPVVAGHIQTMLEEADAFVFTYIATTSFSMTLCTHKPVFCLLPNPEESLLPEALTLLRQRCRFIQTSRDARQRIHFDAAEFETALKSKTEKPDFSIVERCMLPKKSKRVYSL